MRDAPLRLSLLDFSWVQPGHSAAQSLRDTFAVARRADELGLARFWLGEHHLEQHATGSPQLLAALVGASTRRIRIGIGAMLLQYWSPLKLAEDFRLLQAVFGRVDLGVGRGRADNPRSHLALLDGRPGGDGMLADDAYQARIDDLVAHLRNEVPPDHPHAGAAVLPELDVAPEVWVCGGESGATAAARTGARFCCSLFHGRMAPPSVVARYRAGFRPSRELSAPHAAIAVCGTCAATEAEALAVRDSFRHRNYLPSVVGAPEQCRARLRALLAEYGADEIVFLDMAPDAAARLRSLELLVAACEIPAN